jgi:hypothetical protein
MTQLISERLPPIQKEAEALRGEGNQLTPVEPEPLPAYLHAIF